MTEKSSKLLLLLLMASAVSSAGCVTMSGNTVPGECGDQWWKYVYSPKRLVIQNPCVTVRGTVLETRNVLDGDLIAYLKLDPEYAQFSTEENDENLGEGVVELEIVCRHPVYKYFVFRCWGCKNTIQVPHKGDHVEADGTYVLDTRHAHLEIHPVTRIKILESRP